MALPEDERSEEKRDARGDRADPENQEDDERDDGRTAPFGWLSVLIIAALVVGTWFLIQTLSADSKMQDCVQSGRRNCAPIDNTPP